MNVKFEVKRQFLYKDKGGLTSCQTFQIFLLLEQIKDYSNSRNVIFQVIFMGNWKSAVILQLRNKRPKELLHERISQFYFMNSKFEVKM